MKIEILPDPQKSLGGSAVIRVSGANGVPSHVSLSVFDRSRDRWLADQTWQAVPVRFGPYPVTRTSDGGEFTIGSEIVDHIAEYTPLTWSLATAGSMWIGRIRSWRPRAARPSVES